MTPRNSVSASNVVMRRVEWVWEPYVAKHALNLVAGVPGTGKSILTVWIAAMVSKHGHVLMSSSEDDPSIVVTPRLKAAGANLRHIHFLDPHPVLPDGLAMLLDEIVARNAKLVVLDPIQDHLATSIFSPRVTQLLTPLAKALAGLDCGLLAVSHTVKHLPKGSHPLYAVGGTAGGLSRVMRVVHIFGSTEDKSPLRYLLPVKANFLADADKTGARFRLEQTEIRAGTQRNSPIIRPGRLVFEDRDDSVKPLALLSRVTDGEHGPSGPAPDKRIDAGRWLTDLLELTPDGRMEAGAIKKLAHEQGISLATLRRADDEIVKTVKEQAGAAGKRGRGPSYWRLASNGAGVS